MTQMSVPEQAELERLKQRINFSDLDQVGVNTRSHYKCDRNLFSYFLITWQMNELSQAIKILKKLIGITGAKSKFWFWA